MISLCTCTCICPVILLYFGIYTIVNDLQEWLIISYINVTEMTKIDQNNPLPFTVYLIYIHYCNFVSLFMQILTSAIRIRMLVIKNVLTRVVHTLVHVELDTHCCMTDVPVMVS